MIEAFESGRVKIKFLPLLYMIEICSEDVFVLATQRGPELDYVWRRDVSLYGIFCHAVSTIFRIFHLHNSIYHAEFSELRNNPLQTQLQSTTITSSAGQFLRRTHEVTACQAAVTINCLFFRSPCGKCCGIHANDST